MSHELLTALLQQLHVAASPDNQWRDNTCIQDVMFLTPDLKFAWLFRIQPQGPVFPSNATHQSYHPCMLYVQDVSACQTVQACLHTFNIRIDSHSDFQVLNSIGEPIDPTQAPVQTVVLTSTT